METIEKAVITEWKPLDFKMLESEYGEITHQEWCEKEALRIQDEHSNCFVVFRDNPKKPKIRECALTKTNLQHEKESYKMGE